jgi:pimeloyl-ACP methyl ester carboxylesterase
MTTAWTDERVPVAGVTLHLRSAGTGPPVLVLPPDIGSPAELAFGEALARHFTVLWPDHPGYDGSERPAWLRSVRDVAVMYQALLAGRGLARVGLVGLGYGGWIAAEMASMAPTAFAWLVLVGPMGIKPERGEILDQALLSYIDYARAGFEDAAAFERLYGSVSTAQLEQWDVNREMTFRIAWKPYMYNPTLPHLLGAVGARALVVRGAGDRVVPLECSERYVKALPRARLATVEGAGHHVAFERPAELARLVTDFAQAR